MVTYPGQCDCNGHREGELTFSTSVAAVQVAISRSSTEDLRLLGTCYGCIIGAHVCAELDGALTRAAFWAPIPFWKTWEVCVLRDDLWNGQEDKRGVAVTSRIAEGIAPFEMSIQRIHKTPVLVAMGTDDEYAAPASLRYFRSLPAGDARISFRLLRRLSHIVTSLDPEWREFQQTVLKWLVS